MAFLCFGSRSRPRSRRTGTCVRYPQPPKMPRPVKRSGRGGKRLTSLESGKEGQSMAIKQPQSRLMSLPREVRDLIWRETVGNTNICLTIDAYAKPWATQLCMEDSKRRRRKLLAMALSCRQGYLETIHILYSKNKFFTNMQVTLLCLPSVLLPQHACCISDLDVHLFYRAPPAKESQDYLQWISIWKTLASFPALQHLRVRIRVEQTLTVEWMQEEARLLEDVKMVVIPPDFKLVLTWVPGGQILNLPCQILRDKATIIDQTLDIDGIRAELASHLSHIDDLSD